MIKPIDNIQPLVNKVANSGLLVFNLEDHFPTEKIEEIDLKAFLFKELILKEKDFRTALKEKDWVSYQDKIVLIYNSNDAIIPVWAYMLVATHLGGIAKDIYQGDKKAYLNHHYSKLIAALDTKPYTDQRVVIKGCSHKPVPPSAYAHLTARLKPVVKSIMYGEPCSTVPIYKKPRVSIIKEES